MLSIASGSGMLMEYSVVIASSWSYIVVSRITRGCMFLVPDKLAHNTCYDFMQYHVMVRNEIDASGHTVDVSDCGMVSALLYCMLCDIGVVSVETRQDTGMLVVRTPNVGYMPADMSCISHKQDSRPLII
jgi:hypothetical protein